MEQWETFILGAVQGLTEFLPLSSSGHLSLLQNTFSFQGERVSLYVALHFGTLLAIFSFYFKPFKKIFFHLILFPKKRILSQEIQFFLMVLLGTLPAASIGWFFNEILEGSFSHSRIIALGFFFTGGVLFFTKTKKDPAFFEVPSSFPSFSFSLTLAVGLAQALAILPGVSRSGLTIATGILMGLRTQMAALFSFSLSLPIVMGALFFQMQKQSFQLIELKPLLLGVFASYVFGLLGLYVLSYFLKEGHFRMFSFYLWILGGVSFFFF